MRSDERMDELIDAALRSYAERGEISEARVVAARVMARARAAESRRSFWVWAVVVPAAACLLVALAGTILIMRGTGVREIAWVPKAPGVAKGGEGIPPRLKPRVDLGRNGTAEDVPLQGRLVRIVKPPANEESAAERLPKLKVFPTPRPLTAEERALVEFAQQGSPEVKKQVVEAQAHLGDPIAIAELEIRPLDEKDGQ
jgi:hypothetical protein